MTLWFDEAYRRDREDDERIDAAIRDLDRQDRIDEKACRLALYARRAHSSVTPLGAIAPATKGAPAGPRGADHDSERTAAMTSPRYALVTSTFEWDGEPVPFLEIIDRHDGDRLVQRFQDTHRGLELAESLLWDLTTQAREQVA